MSRKYDPYQYPPDLQLARLHKQCNLPGDDNPEGRTCPCCNVQEKKPVVKWFGRDILRDFGKYGGAVVTYFSLLKYYAICTFVSILLYSAFQAYCIRKTCQMEKHNQHLGDKLCVNPLGFWVISTQDLSEVMKTYDQVRSLVMPLLVLRGATFIFLVLINLGSLYVVSNSRSERLMHENPNIQHMSLFFKNVNRSWSTDDLRNDILKNVPDARIQQIFFVNQTDALKYHNEVRTSAYFKLQSRLKPKEAKKQFKKLVQADKKVKQYRAQLDAKVGRAVVTLRSVGEARKVLEAYHEPWTGKVKAMVGLGHPDAFYADPMPRSEEIFWQYVGKESRQKAPMKVLTVFMMIGLLGISYLILGKTLNTQDLDKDNELPIVKKVWSTVMALIVVAFALIFRAFMNKLSDLRHPNTQTSRTMFIVCTTVIYHLLYFLILPTIYFLRAEDQDKSMQLFAVSYQAMNFVIVQLFMAGFDVFYCCWANSTQKLLNKADSGLCQEQLHKRVTAPRFPMEFKLIILFKSWSFLMFYAFEVPGICLIIFLIFVFLLLNDKKNLYQHYRMETIDYHVQRRFLTIYTHFFLIYMCLIFVLTQRLTIEMPLAIALAGLALILQIIYSLQDKRDQNIPDSFTLDDLGTHKSYSQIYEEYLKSLDSSSLDPLVDRVLSGQQTKESLMSERQVNQKLLG